MKIHDKKIITFENLSGCSIEMIRKPSETEGQPDAFDVAFYLGGTKLVLSPEAMNEIKDVIALVQEEYDLRAAEAEALQQQP